MPDSPQIDADISKEIALEGGLANNPNDSGELTYEGISKTNNPQLFAKGLPTDAQVRATYLAKYVESPGFSQIPDPQVQAQLIDWGVNSGPAIAIRALHQIVGVPIDGVLGPATLAAFSQLHAEEVNNLLVAARVKMIGRIVSKNPSQLQFLGGWLDRALQWLES